jgi:hypothetical protein
MLFREVFAFDVMHGALAWPWITFTADGRRLAHLSSPTTVATLILTDGAEVKSGPVFPLPNDLSLAPDDGGKGPKGLRSFSLSADGAHLALAAMTPEGVVLATLNDSGHVRRASIGAIVGECSVQAIAFDRTGARLWVSLENETETLLALFDTTSLDVVHVLRSPALPRPSLHELHIHPHDDAVLLVAACGEAGTFARVAGFAGTDVSLLPTELDGGGISAGFVGFSSHGARVHLAEADELRTHAWPGLHELSSVPFDDEFVSSFSGAVLGSNIAVDGEHTESGEDAVMLFDATAIRGVMLPEEGPSGMWAGALKPNALVTVEPKGDPARGRVWMVASRAATLN